MSGRDEILRLAAEMEAIEECIPPLPTDESNRSLSERVADAILFAQAGNEYGVPALELKIRTLTEENAELRKYLSAGSERRFELLRDAEAFRDSLAAEVERLKAEVTEAHALGAELEARGDRKVAAECARIRRELLAGLPEPCDLSLSEIRELIDRVCREVKS